MFLAVLYKSFYYLVPVIAILTITDVNPIEGACGGGPFEDELVEVKVVHYPEEPTLTGGFVRNVNIGGLACHVLTCCYTSYGFVQCLASVAGTDGDWAVEVFAERFENVDAELLEIRNNLKRRRIVNASCRGSFRAKELAEFEVRRELNFGHNVLFLS